MFLLSEKSFIISLNIDKSKWPRYTFHGFAAEFAKSLRSMGFDAEPVDKAGTGKDLSLDSFQ